MNNHKMMLTRQQLQQQRACVSRRACTQKPRVSCKVLSFFGKTPKEVDMERVWRQADAVCLDVDCTVTTSDSLDLFAKHMGVGEKCRALTHAAMDGTVDLTESLRARIRLLGHTRIEDIDRFHELYPPETRLAPNIETLVSTLQRYGVHVYLISGGFRELIAPLANRLGIPETNVYANEMLWAMRTTTEHPEDRVLSLAGFNEQLATSRNMGKNDVIRDIRSSKNHRTIVMVGDGITDLETVIEADLFIGYGGVVERKAVREADECDWYVYDFGVLEKAMRDRKLRVAMVGSGAWACAMMSIVAANLRESGSDGIFDPMASMWVYEETVELDDGTPTKLTSLINEIHENPKYLPGTHLGDNVVADPDLINVVKDADILIVCTPHQFIEGILDRIVDAGGVRCDARAISLVKGLCIGDNGAQLISEMIRKKLGIDCSVLMGANIASDIAKGEFGEAVIAYNDCTNAKIFRQLVERPHFDITLLPDVAGAELCGTLKNIVAIAAGIVDGLGYGSNTKAAIIRRGLDEMKRFSKRLYPDVMDATFLETCGVADLITTCYSGRNRRVAMEFTQAKCKGVDTTFDELEDRMLNGQKLQGVMTSNELQAFLRDNGWEQEFPLFTMINDVINGRADPSVIAAQPQSQHE